MYILRTMIVKEPTIIEMHMSGENISASRLMSQRRHGPAKIRAAVDVTQIYEYYIMNLSDSDKYRAKIIFQSQARVLPRAFRARVYS